MEHQPSLHNKRRRSDTSDGNFKARVRRRTRVISGQATRQYLLRRDQRLWTPKHEAKHDQLERSILEELGKYESHWSTASQSARQVVAFGHIKAVGVESVKWNHIKTKHHIRRVGARQEKQRVTTTASKTATRAELSTSQIDTLVCTEQADCSVLLHLADGEWDNNSTF